MKVGVLIPTLKTRSRFLKHSLSLLGEQSYQPTDVLVLDDEPPFKAANDIAWKYKIGINRLKESGCDLIIFWEDDDWYRYDYIDTMIKNWVLTGKPTVFGISKTIYYNIVKRRYSLLGHNGRASMMSMLVTNDFTPYWEDVRDQYIDMDIWKKSNYKKISSDVMTFAKPLSVGIKHGIGNCGGGGHFWDDKKFQYDDKDLHYLSSVVDPDSLEFYSSFYNNGNK